MTVDVKAAILGAFHALGGVAYLEKIGHENPPVFCALLGKTLPKDIKAEVAYTLGALIEESMKRPAIPGDNARVIEHQELGSLGQAVARALS